MDNKLPSYIDIVKTYKQNRRVEFTNQLLIDIDAKDKKMFMFNDKLYRKVKQIDDNTIECIEYVKEV